MFSTDVRMIITLMLKRHFWAAYSRYVKRQREKLGYQ